MLQTGGPAYPRMGPNQAKLIHLRSTHRGGFHPQNLPKQLLCRFYAASGTRKSAEPTKNADTMENPPSVRRADAAREGGGEEEEGLDYLERRTDSPGRGILLGIGRNLSKMNRVGGGGVLSCLRRMRFWFWNLLDPARFEIDGLRLTAMTPSVWKMRYLTERTSTHREVTERSLRNRERKGPRRKIYYDLVCFGGSIFVVSYQ